MSAKQPNPESREARFHREGRGQGKLSSYLGWVRVNDFSSAGRTHTPYSPKTGRPHDLLSDGEFGLFLMLEWDRAVIDIREQWPIEKKLTQELALTLGIRHQCYPGTHVPIVMTVDVLATFEVDGKQFYRAFDVKRAADLERPEVVAHLEIVRAALQAEGIPHHLVIVETMPSAVIETLKWLRSAQLDADAVEPYPGFYEHRKFQMKQDLRSHTFDGPLNDYCTDFDRRYSCEAGLALRVIRMLISERSLQMDLNNPEPERAQMACFRLTKSSSLKNGVSQ
jgi:TnsA endonuclease N terminal/TnsA endonuclease C terminal